ncbi:reverse transcriptase domain-containing protein [Tanacetum coccineum]
MGIAEDVVVRVDGFTFLADFVVVNFEPDPRVPIILGRPFLRTAKALIDLYEETLTFRVGKEEFVYYADKSEKNKNKHCVHAISVIDFSKDDPFSGSTTTHSDDPSPSSSPVKTSDNFENRMFAKDLLLLIVTQENVKIKNSNVSDEPVLLNTPLSDKVECFAPEENNDEIDDFLAMEVSSNFEEEQNESSITFSPRSDPLHHEFVGELLTLPARNDLYRVYSRISYPVEDSEPIQEEIDIFLVPDDLIPPGVENDDSEDEVNESPNLDLTMILQFPHPLPEYGY